MDTPPVDKPITKARKAELICLILAVLICIIAFAHWQRQPTVTQSAGSLPPFPGFGASPLFGVVQTSDGNLYGTTYSGGKHGDGTVFRIRMAGQFTTLTSLHSFNNDEHPASGLVIGPEGFLYGTTDKGGQYDRGTLFRMSASGVYETLHSFGVSKNDGGYPCGQLIEGPGGDLYGTTSRDNNNFASLYKITPPGTLTTLHTFADGSNPSFSFILASDGQVYGSTGDWGVADGIKLTQNGEFGGIGSFTRIGGNPDDPLLKIKDGTVYGTTYDTIYRETLSGPAITIYTFPRHSSFQAQCGIPLDPRLMSVSGLTRGTDGDFYGTTADRGKFGEGSVFKITPGGQFTTLFSFGGEPVADPGCG